MTAPRSLFILALSCAAAASAADQWVVYEGSQGPGKGKHIVLVGGDEEYRSEEALPMLGKILARHHGFKCTVLFAVDPKDGTINPNVNNNIPGTETLATADLMVIFTRFRNLPDEQMKPIDEYLAAGKPVVGLRTATHAFNVPKGKNYSHYGNGYNGDKKEWADGFGRLVLGEKWISHHGKHGSQSSRGLIASDSKDHPILRGLKDGDVWGPSDVYGVRLPLPGDSKPLLMGQVLTGMKFEDPPVAGKQNEPMMPLAWVKSYTVPSGKTGRVFTTTLGAATDLTAEGSRRLIVNACYWAVGLEEKIAEKSNVEIVGEYKPSPFKFGGFVKGVKPSDHAMKD